MVIQPDDPEVPRKPGSRRKDKTIKVPDDASDSVNVPNQHSKSE
jgi:hypothetical protein